MFAALSLLAFIVQDPVRLQVGEAVPGQIQDQSAEVHTSTLDTDYSDFPTLGIAFQLQVPATGSYSVELRSSAFDAYLVLMDASGKVLTEDDDGLIGTDARIAGKFRQEKTYTLMACALHGQRGPFEIELIEGKPQRLNQTEKAKEALTYWRGRAEFLEASEQTQSDEYAIAMDGLGEAWMTLGDLAEAEVVYQKSWQVRLEVLGLQDAWTGVSANNLALCLKRQGRFDEALHYYEKALQSWRAEFGNEDPILSKLLENVGALHLRSGQLEKAREHLLPALAMDEAAFGKNSVELVGCLSNLGMLYRQLGEYEDAQASFERALGLLEEKDPMNQEKLSVVLGNLGLVLQERGNFAEALPMQQRALEVGTALYGPGHPRLSSLLSNLGLLYERSGNYSRALGYFQRAVEASGVRTGNTDTEGTMSLVNLGAQLNSLGRLAEAREAIEDALAVLDKIPGAYPEARAECFGYLADFAYREGDLDAAIQYAEKGLNVLEENFGTDSHLYARALGGMALYRRKNGDYEIAIDHHRKSMAIYEQVFGPSHQLLIGDWMGLSRVYFDQEDYPQARDAIQKANQISKEVFGEGHPATAMSIASMAALHRVNNELEASASLYQQALDFYERGYGKTHRLSAKYSAKLAEVYFEMEDWQQALRHQMAGLSRNLQVLDRELPSLTESGRLHMMSAAVNPELMLAALGQLGSTELGAAYDLYVQWKGKVTRLQEASLHISKAEQDQEVLELRGEIQQLATELAALIHLPSAERQADHGERLNELRDKRVELERAFNQRLNLSQQLSVPSWQQVQQAVPGQSIFLDFFVGEEAYVWVVRPDEPLALIPLGDSAQLKQKLEAFLRITKNRGSQALSVKKQDPGQQLAAALWQPLVELIGDAKTIYLSPDGFLCELPFDTLPGKDKTYLLEKHVFHYLNDASGLTQERSEAPTSAGDEGPVFLVGGVNYFRRENSSADTAAEASSSAINRGTVQRRRMGGNWSSLPATREELQTLRDLHEYVLEWSAPITVLEGKEASEERVRKQILGKKYVHLATHGYFEPDNLPSLLADAAAHNQDSDLHQQYRAVGMLPGLLSGLVFAGVNSDDYTGDDGYLSAEEIQHLDLSACELVVLSACETALGSARSGEGLMSLRRAFSVAGANSVVSSLWKVDDRATAELIKEFYTNLWQRQMPRAEALHQAKLSLLRQNRAENNGDALPSTWGAFVLSGDWR